MKTHSHLVLLFSVIAFVFGAPSAPALVQGGKADALKPYLPREPSIRLPQRNSVRGGIGPGATSHLSKGETEYRAGRNAAAVPELKQAVKESPDSYDSHYLLALTLTETGQFKEAIAEFEKAIA